jgi:FkbM family methyltransferase
VHARGRTGVVSGDGHRQEVLAALRHYRPGGGAPDLRPVTRVATDVGPLFIAADDAVILPHIRAHGCWEPEEGLIIDRHLEPGAGAVVIGAHVGYHVLRISRAVGPRGRVVAVEPEAQNFAMLCANLVAGGAGNVRPIEAQAADRSGTVGLSAPSNGNSGDYRAFPSPDRPRVPVAALSLDAVLPADPPIGLVLCDAQGTDHQALRGMSRTIARDRPTILVEFWPAGIEQVGDEPEAVLAEYEGWGYEVRFAAGGGDGLVEDRRAAVRRARAGALDHATLLLRPR